MRLRSWRLWIAALATMLAGAGCFDGRAAACAVSCAGAGAACPSGLLCDEASLRCVAAAGECGAPTTDAAPTDAGPTACDPGTLCGLDNPMDFTPSGWFLNASGCTTGYVDGTLVLASSSGACANGERCGLISPARVIGTSRVVASVDRVVTGSAGDLTVRIEKDG